MTTRPTMGGLDVPVAKRVRRDTLDGLITHDEIAAAAAVASDHRDESIDDFGALEVHAPEIYELHGPSEDDEDFEFDEEEDDSDDGTEEGEWREEPPQLAELDLPPMPQVSPPPPSPDRTAYVAGICRQRLLYELWKHAKPMLIYRQSPHEPGIPPPPFRPFERTRNADGTPVTFVGVHQGRKINVHVFDESTKLLKCNLYDREHGRGSMARIVDALRKDLVGVVFQPLELVIAQDKRDGWVV